jgi:hypothetical protein
MVKPLRKKGFPLFDDMAELVDGTRATGQYAFRAGQPTPAPPTQNAAASTSTSYEPAMDSVLLDMSLDGGRDSDEELDRNVRVPLVIYSPIRYICTTNDCLGQYQLEYHCQRAQKVNI